MLVTKNTKNKEAAPAIRKLPVLALKYNGSLVDLYRRYQDRTKDQRIK